MSVRKKGRNPEGLQLPKAATADLRGRQSVRATFKLAPDTIGLIGTVARHLGIKQKSLIDHLIEDTASLESIARHINQGRTSRDRGVPKTLVVSRKSLDTLDLICERYAIDRDVLVEYSIRRLTAVLEREKARHRLRQKLVAQLEKQLRHQQNLLAEAVRSLGPSDPVSEKLSHVVRTADKSLRHLQVLIDRGRRTEAS